MARVGVTAISCVLALAAAEAAARFVLRGRAFEPRPRVYVNRRGFREREFDDSEPSRYRIAVIGDSFTWGVGVEQDARFTNEMERLLGPAYQVLNFGLSGNNLPEHVDTLDTALGCHPDFVLLQLFQNDFETSGMQRHRPQMIPLLPVSLDHTLRESSAFYHLAVDDWYRLQVELSVTEGYPDFVIRHLRDPSSAESVETSAMLRRFLERARAAGVPAGGVMFPAFYSMTRDPSAYPFRFLDDRVEKIFAAEGVPFLDLLPAFASVRNPASLQITQFDAHPNAVAHRIAAAAIVAAFRQHWHPPVRH